MDYVSFNFSELGRLHLVNPEAFSTGLWEFEGTNSILETILN